LLVPVKNSAALADALRVMVQNPDVRRTMGRKGREIVVAEFSSERVISETLNVYRELLAVGAKGSRELNLQEQGAR
jgi:glycosyltransferase involved in cell wall biosynthesis